MIFSEPLISGTLVRRYKRFLADIRLDDADLVTAHCPNSGSMKSCMGEGWPVRLSKSDNPKRKLKYTWEMVHNGESWIGINTILANRIAEEGIRNGVISELDGYSRIRREVNYGDRSRVDLLLEEGGKRCYVEIKNVTLIENGINMFPDAVTARGLKHLQELSRVVEQGDRAVMLFLVQRSDGDSFRAAAHIDHDYAVTLQQVVEQGVEMLVYRADVTPDEIVIQERIG